MNKVMLTMKCDRSSQDCFKEAKFKVDVYKVKRVEKATSFDMNGTVGLASFSSVKTIPLLFTRIN